MFFYPIFYYFNVKNAQLAMGCSALWHRFLPSFICSNQHGLGSSPCMWKIWL